MQYDTTRESPILVRHICATLSYTCLSLSKYKFNIQANTFFKIDILVLGQMSQEK